MDSHTGIGTNSCYSSEYILLVAPSQNLSFGIIIILAESIFNKLFLLIWENTLCDGISILCILLLKRAFLSFLFLAPLWQYSFKSLTTCPAGMHYIIWEHCAYDVVESSSAPGNHCKHYTQPAFVPMWLNHQANLCPGSTQ